MYHFAPGSSLTTADGGVSAAGMEGSGRRGSCGVLGKTKGLQVNFISMFLSTWFLNWFP